MTRIYLFVLGGCAIVAVLFAWFVSALGQATEECEDGSSSPQPQPGRTGPSSHVRKIPSCDLYDWAAFDDKQQGREKR